MTSKLKNQYIDKISDIVNKYNHTNCKTIKTKSVIVITGDILTLVKKPMMKILN